MMERRYVPISAEVCAARHLLSDVNMATAQLFSLVRNEWHPCEISPRVLMTVDWEMKGGVTGLGSIVLG